MAERVGLGALRCAAPPRPLLASTHYADPVHYLPTSCDGHVAGQRPPPCAVPMTRPDLRSAITPYF